MLDQWSRKDFNLTMHMKTTINSMKSNAFVFTFSDNIFQHYNSKPQRRTKNFGKVSDSGEWRVLHQTLHIAARSSGCLASAPDCKTRQIRNLLPDCHIFSIVWRAIWDNNRCNLSQSRSGLPGFKSHNYLKHGSFSRTHCEKSGKWNERVPLYHQYVIS
jgi:hypothetical protein